MYENLILITIDALRHDYFTKEYMPKTFKILKNTLIFKNAFSQGPSTPPSTISIMTSTYPLMFGYPRVSPYLITLPELLMKQGFITVGISQNPYHSRVYGYDRGFLEYYDFRASKFNLMTLIEMYKHTIFNIVYEKFSKKFLYGVDTPYFSASVITALAIDTIKRLEVFKGEKVKSKRFFLWLHYMDLHNPLTPPLMYAVKNLGKIYHVRIVNRLGYNNAKPQYTEIVKGLYTEMLKYIDKHLGELLEFLMDNKLLERTAIIITSDHGEEFFEHGNYGHFPKLYEELIHIPLLIYAPKATDVLKECEISDFVELVDIAPTVIDLLGLRRFKQFMGRSLLDILQNESRGYVICECGHVDPSHRVSREYYRWCIRSRRWKLIYWPARGEVTLYDLKKDPLEKIDVSHENSDIVRPLIAILNKHFRKELSWKIKIKVRKGVI